MTEEAIPISLHLSSDNLLLSVELLHCTLFAMDRYILLNTDTRYRNPPYKRPCSYRRTLTAINRVSLAGR